MLSILCQACRVCGAEGARNTLTWTLQHLRRPDRPPTERNFGHFLPKDLEPRRSNLKTLDFDKQDA
jgi:hypothetical protein